MARKSKSSRRAAKAKARPAAKPATAAAPAGAGKLREVIGELIDAHNRGDVQQRETAVRALEKLGASGSSELRQRAIEARAAAGHPVPVDSVRLLGEIAARLGS
jgi:hypothetical protein